MSSNVLLSIHLVNTNLKCATCSTAINEKKCVYDGIYNMVMRAYAQSSGRFTPVISYAILSAISCPL
jgi:hypothetical protein